MASSSFALSHDFAYIHLEILSTSDEELVIDLITWRLLVGQGMTRALGLSGDAIAVDILQLVNDKKVNQCWIRVPEQKLSVVWSALSGASLPVNDAKGATVNVSLRVKRASRSLVSTAGPDRNVY